MGLQLGGLEEQGLWNLFHVVSVLYHLPLARAA